VVSVALPLVASAPSDALKRGEISYGRSLFPIFRAAGDPEACAVTQKLPFRECAGEGRDTILKFYLSEAGDLGIEGG
jgi:hypothetical protein